MEGTDEDDQKFEQFVANLDTRDVYLSVLNRIKTSKCPFCENTDWYIETSGQHGLMPPLTPAFIPKDPRAYFGIPPSIPVLVLTCSNCGFVRMHNITFLNRERGNG